jgi:hypothetical protein
MTIYSIIPEDAAGQVGIKPRKVAILCDNTLSQVTTAGFLNGVANANITIQPTDEIHIIYSYVPSTGVGIFGIFLPTIALGTGLITLALWSNPGDVLLPVVSGDLPAFVGTSGQIQDSGILATNVVSKAAVNTMAAGSSIVLAKVNGTEAANAVTASGVAGVITTSSLTTAGAGTYVITWTNTFITATSVIGLTIQGGTNTTENINFKVIPGAGSATLTIYNLTAATALNGTIFIGYTVL